jgi:uncharacterized protein
MRNPIRTIIALPRNTILALITLYQSTLSPDHGPLRHLHPYGYCRHAPTCSQYAKEHIHNQGLIIGGANSLRRLLTCHPWRQPDPERVRELLARRRE